MRLNDLIPGERASGDGPRPSRRSAAIGGAAASVAGFFLLGVIVLLMATGGFDRPEAGQISVIRNGGPLDDRGIREVLPPGTGNSWIGFFSSEHEYPASSVQRFYTITADDVAGDKPGVDVVRTQTSDGFLVGLEGTFYFTTAFDVTANGQELAAKFDDQFGVRTFAVPGSGERLPPWDGDDGWAAFLDQIVRPIIDNQIRTAMLRFRCEELISSCALVARQGNVGAGDVESGQENNANLQRIEEEVVRGVIDELEATLGEEYLTNWRFELVRPTLPDEIQASINSAQSAFARITEARAEAERAKAQRDAAQTLASVYEQSPALAQIQMIREARELEGANIYIGIDPVVPTQPGP